MFTLKEMTDSGDVFANWTKMMIFFAIKKDGTTPDQMAMDRANSIGMEIGLQVFAGCTNEECMTLENFVELSELTLKRVKELTLEIA